MSGDTSHSQIELALDILRLLSQQPIFRKELIERLSEFPKYNSVGDLDQKVVRTIAKLRECGFEIKGVPHHPYTLVESSFPVILTPAQREAIDMAVRVLSDMGFAKEAAYLERIDNSRRKPLPAAIRTNFSPPSDYSENDLSKTIQELQNRIQHKRRYTIRYCDSQERTKIWDCSLSQLRLHDGTLYLFAHTPDELTKHQEPAEKNKMFRIDRILQVLPASSTLWGTMEFPTLKARYRAIGALRNYQPRRHSERVDKRDPNGEFVEIITEEDYIFGFRQRILHYGESVVVLEPKWFAKSIADSLQKASSNYG
jgi:predicted DNA-binding transcriptional regulator YafY